MNDEEYRQHCCGLFADFAQSLLKQAEQLPADDPLRELAQACVALTQTDGDMYTQAPPLVARLFTTYPELAPLLHRQFLWFLGGDCLHYMADKEIEQFQTLEELRQQALANGKAFNLKDARAKLLNLQ